MVGEILDSIQNRKVFNTPLKEGCDVEKTVLHYKDAANPMGITRRNQKETIKTIKVYSGLRVPAYRVLPQQI